MKVRAESHTFESGDAVNRTELLVLDLVDFELEVSLPMTSLTCVVFASAELLHDDLITLELTQNRGDYLCPFELRLADLGAVLNVSDHENTLELDRLGILGHVVPLDLERLSFFNLVLMFTVTDNRVH